MSEQQTRDVMHAIAEALSEGLGPRVGFAVLLWNWNDDSGQVNYISNGSEDMLVALKECISKAEFGDQGSERPQ